MISPLCLVAVFLCTSRWSASRPSFEDFHFHDLRHTWPSWHVQRGTPLMVLKELGGRERIDFGQTASRKKKRHRSGWRQVLDT
ncbi:hypothetical protein [Pigmentiphaga daeguensis]|uniref:hypothetical protein n=1 Tax=Pigmentiphaga daeguensis TaxID=414049 RepID=UPI003CD083FE